MENTKQHKTLKQILLSSAGWSVFTMFVWELVEEGLENLIAYALSSAVAIFVTKALSTLAIISATQGIKVSIKRFLMPLIKTLTYKEGNDKMKFLKNYFTLMWGNKITGTSIGVGFAGLVWFQTLVPYATACWWIALITFVVFYNLGAILGGEYLYQILERLKSKALTKEQNAKLKAIEERAKELASKQFEALKVEAERQLNIENTQPKSE
jgi:hypothetical protein